VPNHKPKKGAVGSAKNPVHLYAQVLRSAVARLRKEYAFCVAQLIQTRYSRPEDLGSVPAAKQGPRLKHTSKKWVLEFEYFNQLSTRWLANQSDEHLARRVFESLVKLGFVS
jgi:hypothetical protein